MSCRQCWLFLFLFRVKSGICIVSQNKFHPFIFAITYLIIFGSQWICNKMTGKCPTVLTGVSTLPDYHVKRNVYVLICPVFGVSLKYAGCLKSFEQIGLLTPPYFRPFCRKSLIDLSTPYCHRSLSIHACSLLKFYLLY